MGDPFDEQDVRLADPEGRGRFPLEAARGVALEVIRRLDPYVTRAEIAGSVRRGKPWVKDVEVVAVPRPGASDLFGGATGAAADIRDLVALWGHRSKGGEKYLQLEDVFGSGLTLDLFLVTPPAEWGAIFAIRTGPAHYSTMLVSKLRGRMMRCEDGHVVESTGRGLVEHPAPTEEDFFRLCGVEWVPPEERR